MSTPSAPTPTKNSRQSRLPPANSAAPFRTSALKAVPNHNLAPLHSNYGVKTTSKVEWSFVVADSDAPQQPGLTRWPAESDVKLRDRDRCRRKPFLKELIDKAREHNERLKDANQPPLCLLYTSPSPRDRSLSRMPSSA